MAISTLALASESVVGQEKGRNREELGPGTQLFPIQLCPRPPTPTPTPTHIPTHMRAAQGEGVSECCLRGQH